METEAQSKEQRRLAILEEIKQLTAQNIGKDAENIDGEQRTQRILALEKELLELEPPPL